MDRRDRRQPGEHQKVAVARKQREADRDGPDQPGATCIGASSGSTGRTLPPLPGREGDLIDSRHECLETRDSMTERKARMEPGHPHRVMLLYNNVARLRQFLGAIRQRSRHCFRGNVGAWPDSAAAGAIDLDFQIADLLAQRVAVDAQKVGGADLVAAGCRQRRGSSGPSTSRRMR